MHRKRGVTFRDYTTSFASNAEMLSGPKHASIVWPQPDQGGHLVPARLPQHDVFQEQAFTGRKKGSGGNSGGSKVWKWIRDRERSTSTSKRYALVQSIPKNFTHADNRQTPKRGSSPCDRKKRINCCMKFYVIDINSIHLHSCVYTLTCMTTTLKLSPRQPSAS